MGEDWNSMPYLIAAVVLVGLVSVLNLLLAAGAIKRLREPRSEFDTRRLEGVEKGRAASGSPIKPFTAQTIEGVAISDSQLADGTVVAFFVPGCEPCEEGLPGFIELVDRAGRARESVLAVVANDIEDTTPLAQQLAFVAQVVLDPLEGEMATAFATSTFPAYYRLRRDGGELVVAEVMATATPVLVDGNA
ncbi:peroxiredoxin family protein [Streptosporangium sp. NPDC003464]